MKREEKGKGKTQEPVMYWDKEKKYKEQNRKWIMVWTYSELLKTLGGDNFFLFGYEF